MKKVVKKPTKKIIKPVKKPTKKIIKPVKKAKIEKELPTDKELEMEDKIRELRDIIKELEESKESFEKVKARANSRYFQESIFSDDFSNDVKLEISKQTGIDIVDIG